MRDLSRPWGVIRALTVGLLLMASAQSASGADVAGTCKKLPAVCQATCMKCKCETVPNPVLCLTVCNVPKECRAALAAGGK